MQPNWIGQSNPLDELPERPIWEQECKKCHHDGCECYYKGNTYCVDCIIELFYDQLQTVADPNEERYDVKYDIIVMNEQLIGFSANYFDRFGEVERKIDLETIEGIEL